MTDASAYFLDWRPVTSIPACNPPNCSDVKTVDRETLLKQRCVAEPDDQDLVERSFKQAVWRWRDDGLVIFRVEMDEAFLNVANAYFAGRAQPSPTRDMIHEMVKRLWKPAGNDIDDLLRVVLRSLASFVSAYIKDETRHEHAFDGRPTVETSSKRLAKPGKKKKQPKPNPASSLSHIFLRIEPMRLSWPCQTLTIAKPSRGTSRFARVQYKIVQTMLADPKTSPIDLLPYDSALVALRRQRSSGDATRPALYELRRVYSGLVDDCLRVLPLVKKLTLFGHADGMTLSWALLVLSGLTIGALSGLLFWNTPYLQGPASTDVFSPRNIIFYEMFGIVLAGTVLYNTFLPPKFEIEWPLTGLLYVGATFAAVAMLAYSSWLVTRANIFQDFRVMFWATLLPFLICALLYSLVETWFRRNAVVQAIVRTAGVLEFGALLASVVGHAAFNAGQHRGPEPITHDQSAAIIAHKLEMEQHKRQMAVEILTFLLGIIAAALAVLQILVPLFHPEVSNPSPPSTG